MEKVFNVEQKIKFLNPISQKEKELFIHINNLQKASSLEAIFSEKIYDAKNYTSSMVILIVEYMQDQYFSDSYFQRYKNFKLLISSFSQILK